MTEPHDPVEVELVDPDEGDDVPNDGEEPFDPFMPGTFATPGEGGLVPVDPLQQYINAIKQHPSLTREEEAELAARVRDTGDREAAFRLVTANLMLVVKIAFEFRAQFQNMLDLIQEGNYGLLRAVKKFDPFKGTRLSTYASYWIRAYMLKYLLDNWRLVKVGTTNARRRLLYNLREVEQKLLEGGEIPDTKLLAEHFGASEQDVIDIQQSLGAADQSIHQPVEEGSSRTLGETLAAGDDEELAETIANEELTARLRAAIERLKPSLRPADVTLLEKRILADEPMTLQEIGALHGVTREAIRQSEVRLMKKLKEYLAEELGEDAT